MKRLLITFSFLIGLPMTSFALPIGNPADPKLYHSGFMSDEPDPCSCCMADSFSLRFGYYGDFIFNRHVKRSGSRDIEHMSMDTNAALLALNWCEKVDLFGIIGATRASVESSALRFPAPFTSHVRFDLDYAPDFTWGIGLRAALWDWGCFTLGAEGQYFYTNMRFNRFTLADQRSEYYNRLSTQYREAQFGLALSYMIANVMCGVDFVPYVGVKWSRLWNDHNELAPFGLTLSDFENSKRFGYAVGVTLVDCGMASLGVEGRFDDEQALYVNGQIRF